MAVHPAVCSVSATTVVATAIVLSARASSVKSGYRQEKKNCCLYHTSMWCLLYLTSLTSFACTSLMSYTTCCLKQHGVL